MKLKCKRVEEQEMRKDWKLKMKIKGLKVPTDQPAPTPRYLTCNLKEYNSKKTPHAYFLENMEYYEKRCYRHIPESFN